MTEMIASLASLGRRYDAVFCDLWGCLHNGHAPFPAAVAALTAFRAQGGKVVLLTNAPRPFPAIVAQLDRMGVPREAWDLVVSSGDATQRAAFSGSWGQKIAFIGADKDETIFTDFPEGFTPAPFQRVAFEEAEVVLCTGLAQDLTETPEDYKLPLMRARNADLTLLCANPDIIVDYGDKRLWCAGALARDYAAMGGKVVYFGKPHAPVYDLAREKLAGLGLRDPQILCIGDGIATDIAGGMAEGLDTLFVTGGISAAEFGPDAARPDPAKVQAFLTRHQLSATFAIPALG